MFAHCPSREPGISLPQGICHPLIFMSQYCHFLLVITSLGKFNLALITRMKVSPKTKKLTYMFFLPYLGAFARLFFKNPNAQGLAWGRGEWTLLQMTDS